jgi:hypothetical protein
MAHVRSLTTHQMFVYMYHSKTNEISFTTHPLHTAYYVLMYHITLWFLFSLPCQTWWWFYNKRAETCCLSSDSYILIKFCWVLTYHIVICGFWTYWFVPRCRIFPRVTNIKVVRSFWMLADAYSSGREVETWMDNQYWWVRMERMLCWK